VKARRGADIPSKTPLAPAFNILFLILNPYPYPKSKARALRLRIRVGNQDEKRGGQLMPANRMWKKVNHIPIWHDYKKRMMIYILSNKMPARKI
jgi:hypothetical protein